MAEGWWRPFNMTAAFTDIVESYLGPEHLMLHGPSSTEADVEAGKMKTGYQKSQLKSVRFNRASDPQKPKRSNRKKSARGIGKNTARTGIDSSRSIGEGGVSPLRNRGKAGVGWVTLSKGSNVLVRRREKLNAGQRQGHMQQWERRIRTDKTLAATAYSAAANKDASGDRDGRKKDKNKGVEKAVAQKHNVFTMELIDDIGFAYGGVEPGVLHAHGKLHEVHKCTYSVGRAGLYLLHVRLRNQALSLPGSPFRLVVKPDKPHAQSTSLSTEFLPLRGTVGNNETDGCHVLLRCRDKMGNVCDSGGANVMVSSSSKSVTASCVDNNDGSYSLAWRSVYCGTSEVSIMINGALVQGSPALMRLTSTKPDVSKTELSGEGLSEAHAGKDSHFFVHFVDGYLNTAQPEAELQLGMKLVTEASLKNGSSPDLTLTPSHPFKSTWIEEGKLQVTYIATIAGGK